MAAAQGEKVAWAGLAGVFLLDRLTDPYIQVGLLYVPLLLLALAVPKTRLAWSLAAAASVLTLLDAIRVAHQDWTTTTLNEGIILIVLWAVAAGVVTYRTAANEYLDATRLLENLKSAIDQSAIVATTDVSGRITFVNDTFCEISKYSRQELLGEDHRLLNSGFHDAAFIRDLWRTIARGRVWRGELRNRAKDGSLYWVDTTIVPFFDARGKPWQYMAIRYDVTAKKLQEQRLRDQAALAALGEFSAVVAHEVRNPLAGIRNGVQLLAAELQAQPDSVSLAAEIIARVDALNAVIGDLLTFARPRALNLTDVDVPALLAQMIVGLRHDPATSGVAVTLAGDASVRVSADADQLRLVFGNLLLNAAQAATGRGPVDVHVAGDARTCVVRIADRGPGIAPAMRAKVFEPFFTTKHRGTGLGLPTVKRVVDAHQGEIEILDNPGGGTIVAVTLPIRQTEEATTAVQYAGT